MGMAQSELYCHIWVQPRVERGRRDASVVATAEEVTSEQLDACHSGDTASMLVVPMCPVGQQ